MIKIFNTITKELNKNSTFVSSILFASLFIIFVNAQNSPYFLKSSYFRIFAVFFTAISLHIDLNVGTIVGLIMFTGIVYGELRKDELFENSSSTDEDKDSNGCIIGKEVFSTLYNKCIGDITHGASFDELKEENMMETVVIPEYNHTIEKPSRGVSFDSTKKYLIESGIIDEKIKKVNQRSVDSEMNDFDMDNKINRSEFNTYRIDGEFKSLSEPEKESMFRLFDTNSDNLIDEEELSTRRAKLFINNLDSNSDGIVSRQELGRPGEPTPIDQTEDNLKAQSALQEELEQEMIPNEFFEGFTSLYPKYSFL
jgi:hypothetical protein